MDAPDQTIGFFTTDEHLVVRSWDERLETMTGISREAAQGKPLTELVSDLESRGLLTRFSNVINQGVVEVLSPAFHHHLIPCSSVVPSRHFDRMQQQVSISPLKEGERITGTLVSIEDVTVRREREKDAAQDLTVPDEMKRLQAARTLAQGEEESETLLDALSDDSWRVRREAVDGLIQHGSQDAIATLLKTLIEEHRDFGVLSSAIEVLSLSRIDVLSPLVRLLSEPDEGLRLQVAQILGEKGDMRAVPALVEALDDPDTNVRYHAIEALGKLQAGDAADALMAIVESRDFFLAFPALDALIRIGDASVTPRLVPFLKDDLLRIPTAELLGRLGDDAVIFPLVDLLNEPGISAAAVAQALVSLYDRYETVYGEGGHVTDLVRMRIRAPGVQNLLDAIDAAQGGAIKPLAVVLGWMEGQAMERALSRLLGNPEARKEVVEALIRHGRRVTDLLVEQLRAEDFEVRQAALPHLLNTLKDEDPWVRFYAARSIGRHRSTEASEALSELITRDPAHHVRIEAIKALAEIDGKEIVTLLEPLIKDNDPDIARAAIRALGIIRHPGALPLLLEALRSTDPELRIAALYALGESQGPEVPENLQWVAATDRDEGVVQVAMKILADFSSPEAIRALINLTADPRHRSAAVSALKEVPEKNIHLLAKGLSHPQPSVKRAVVEALARIKKPQASEHLLKAVKDPDPQVRLDAVKALDNLGSRQARGELLQVAHADPDLAVRRAAKSAVSRL